MNLEELLNYYSFQKAQVLNLLRNMDRILEEEGTDNLLDRLGEINKIIEKIELEIKNNKFK